MTAGTLIGQVDALEPNQYTQAQKLLWLSELDAQIFAEIVTTHEDPIREAFEPYSATTDELLVPFPWDGDLYRWALIAQIRLHNAEGERYNQAITAFSAAYQSFADQYNRSHRPKAAGSRFIF